MREAADLATVFLPETTFRCVPQQEGARRAEVLAVPEEVRPDYAAFAIRCFLDPHGDTALARFRIESVQAAECEITFTNASGGPRDYHYGLGAQQRGRRSSGIESRHSTVRKDNQS